MAPVIRRVEDYLDFLDYSEQYVLGIVNRTEAQIERGGMNKTEEKMMEHHSMLHSSLAMCVNVTKFVTRHRHGLPQDPLWMAAREGNVELFMLQVQLEGRGSMEDTDDTNGYTGLHYACSFPRPRPPIVQELLRLNVNTNCRDMDNATPLHLACQNGNFEIANMLLAHANEPLAMVNATDVLNETPLHGLGRSMPEPTKEVADLIDLLVSHGADIDRPNSKGHRSQRARRAGLAVPRGQRECARPEWKYATAHSVWIPQRQRQSTRFAPTVVGLRIETSAAQHGQRRHVCAKLPKAAVALGHGHFDGQAIGYSVHALAP